MDQCHSLWRVQTEQKFGEIDFRIIFLLSVCHHTILGDTLHPYLLRSARPADARRWYLFVAAVRHRGSRSRAAMAILLRSRPRGWPMIRRYPTARLAYWQTAPRARAARSVTGSRKRPSPRHNWRRSHRRRLWRGLQSQPLRCCVQCRPHGRPAARQAASAHGQAATHTRAQFASTELLAPAIAVARNHGRCLRRPNEEVFRITGRRFGKNRARSTSSPRTPARDLLRR